MGGSPWKQITRLSKAQPGRNISPTIPEHIFIFNPTPLGLCFITCPIAQGQTPELISFAPLELISFFASVTGIMRAALFWHNTSKALDVRLLTEL
ncbi:hypothetical protein RCC89_20570 [Cytophagaceae bacterium ABcell3]|nr:hypothetical protein RCC89_20570 [Cytophagaceae bacterium ABcell3]